ncbi:2-dehydropantoate 2-reductase [Delitschia confertaspora ATCC 74209]|uniref:2-dehydropantoate 2-reductase n=1 Tax=Delitschia confertaspora ATCC 74209 TaxID=1513339 RepID=A0A9P4JJT5_9PLEO|nr:2-dehydropantoate 2-reductase [Delitschia confertaspora ATCC 74209]
MTDSSKKSVLVIGGGAVGAIAALNLEVGGLATVTVVLRSNFEVVNRDGYHIQSCDHGILENWKPSHVLPQVPAITDGTRYDYVVLATKNIPDILPIADVLKRILSAGNSHTTVVLIQNGLNIAKPLLESFSQTPVLSGVSLIGSAEIDPGVIVQDDKDRLLVGAFDNPNVPAAKLEEKAKDFVRIYGAGGKTECVYSPNVLHDRWRKLVYNACLNPICAVTGLDTGRIRLAPGAVEELVEPAMREIVEAARMAAGVELGVKVVKEMVECDPLEIYLRPSMLADVRKGNFLEFENLLGEPLREGTAKGVQMPTLRVLYSLCKAIQWRTKESKGLVSIPPKRNAV